MDIYSQKSRWKIYLAIGGGLILLISVSFTSYLTQQLAREERTKIDVWSVAMNRIVTPISNQCNEDNTVALKVLEGNKTIPVILTDTSHLYIEGINFGEALDTNTTYLRKQLAKLEKMGSEPIRVFEQEIWYQESWLLRLIRYFPIFQMLLIGAFIALGYLGFSTARRAEQNRVWVGMAKETAHQLGTPISGIMAWVEYLKTSREKDSEIIEIADELAKDVHRLELVAGRFSKIGAEPELHACNLFEQLEGCKLYMARRSPKRVRFEFPDPKEELEVMINPPLFDWVIENLLRNALDAMDGRGVISARIYEEKGYACIDISDTGKGIPGNKLKTVFEPGFTTKQRGWGLGLSLAKRIISNYHNGKIFVKESIVGKGTTFTVKIPVPVSD